MPLCASITLVQPHGIVGFIYFVRACGSYAQFNPRLGKLKTHYLPMCYLACFWWSSNEIMQASTFVRTDITDAVYGISRVEVCVRTRVWALICTRVCMHIHTTRSQGPTTTHWQSNRKITYKQSTKSTQPNEVHIHKHTHKAHAQSTHKNKTDKA